MLHVLEHSLIDSLKVLGFSVIIYIILSFIEEKITNLLKKNKKTTPIIGAAIGGAVGAVQTFVKDIF